MVWAALKMILGLGAILLVLFLLIRYGKRASLGKNELTAEGRVRLLTTQTLAPRKYISLVEIVGKVLVLGVSDSQVTLLDKIENPECVEKIINHHAAQTAPFSFRDYWAWGSKGLKSGKMRG
jgi:flagellar protein FliO/FliZ